MTDVDATPPPPPPPRHQPSGYDFLRPFVYLFDDPRWLAKLLMGGVFVFLCVLLIGVPFLFGYVAQLVRNVIARHPRPLPEWDRLGDYFHEGLVLACVAIAYYAPVVVVSVAMGVPAILVSSLRTEASHNISSALFGCSTLLTFPLGLAITFFLPAALLATIRTGRFASAFEFREIWKFIENNIGNYLLALIIHVVARVIAVAGLVTLCGFVFFEFWAIVVSAYAFAEAERMSAPS